MDEMNTMEMANETMNENEEYANNDIPEEAGSNPLNNPKFIAGALTAAGLAGAAITAGVSKLIKNKKEKKAEPEKPKVKKQLKIRNPFYTVEVKPEVIEPEVVDPNAQS